MLTNREKRFIKHWEEQRTGGKWQYFLLYILAGTFISTIIIAFLTVMFLPLVRLRFEVIALISVVLMTGITVFAWYRNEKRFKAIIRREIAGGQMRDGAGSAAP